MNTCEYVFSTLGVQGRVFLISRSVGGPGCQRLSGREVKQKQKTGGTEGGAGHSRHQHPVTTPDTAVSHGPQAGTGSSHLVRRRGHRARRAQRGGSQREARLPNLAYARSRRRVLALTKAVFRPVMQL